MKGLRSQGAAGIQETMDASSSDAAPPEEEPMTPKNTQPKESPMDFDPPPHKSVVSLMADRLSSDLMTAGWEAPPKSKRRKRAHALGERARHIAGAADTLPESSTWKKQARRAAHEILHALDEIAQDHRQEAHDQKRARNLAESVRKNILKPLKKRPLDFVPDSIPECAASLLGSLTTIGGENTEYLDPSKVQETFYQSFQKALDQPELGDADYFDDVARDSESLARHLRLLAEDIRERTST